MLQRRGKEAVELYDRALRIQVSMWRWPARLATLGGALDALEGSRRPRRHAGARPPSRRAFSVRTIRRRGSHSPISIIGYPLQGKELAGSSGVVASGVVPALALDVASVPSTAPPTESDSMAGRIAAKRRARRKQFAPSRPLGAPTVSMLDALERQQEEDKAARKATIKDFWRADVRG